MPAVDPHFPSRLFCFGVRLEGSLHAEAGFTEVSGLERSDEATEPRKIPGLNNHANITLKRGVMARDTDFSRWVLDHSEHGTPQPRRQNVIVELYAQTGFAQAAWKALDAWPSKWTGVGGNGDQLALETLELGCSACEMLGR